MQEKISDPFRTKNYSLRPQYTKPTTEFVRGKFRNRKACISRHHTGLCGTSTYKGLIQWRSQNETKTNLRYCTGLYFLHRHLREDTFRMTEACLGHDYQPDSNITRPLCGRKMGMIQFRQWSTVLSAPQQLSGISLSTLAATLQNCQLDFIASNDAFFDEQ